MPHVAENQSFRKYTGMLETLHFYSGANSNRVTSLHKNVFSYAKVNQVSNVVILNI